MVPQMEENYKHITEQQQQKDKIFVKQSKTKKTANTTKSTKITRMITYLSIIILNLKWFNFLIKMHIYSQFRSENRTLPAFLRSQETYHITKDRHPLSVAGLGKLFQIYEGRKQTRVTILTSSNQQTSHQHEWEEIKVPSSWFREQLQFEKRLPYGHV